MICLICCFLFEFRRFLLILIDIFDRFSEHFPVKFQMRAKLLKKIIIYWILFWLKKKPSILLFLVVCFCFISKIYIDLKWWKSIRFWYWEDFLSKHLNLNSGNLSTRGLMENNFPLFCQQQVVEGKLTHFQRKCCKIEKNFTKKISLLKQMQSNEDQVLSCLY